VSWTTATFLKHILSSLGSISVLSEMESSIEEVLHTSHALEAAAVAGLTQAFDAALAALWGARQANGLSEEHEAAVNGTPELERQPGFQLLHHRRREGLSEETATTISVEPTARVFSGSCDLGFALFHVSTHPRRFETRCTCVSTQMPTVLARYSRQSQHIT
jgi:hypothetical protein